MIKAMKLLYLCSWVTEYWGTMVRKKKNVATSYILVPTKCKFICYPIIVVCAWQLTEQMKKAELTVGFPQLALHDFICTGTSYKKEFILQNQLTPTKFLLHVRCFISSTPGLVDISTYFPLSYVCAKWMLVQFNQRNLHA